jgi:pimeloyl-ACP methyl ester carboxylesterase
VSGAAGAARIAVMTIYQLDAAPVTVDEEDGSRTYLLLHGGAGPAAVRSFGALLARRRNARVVMPTHPGFDGTPRPDTVATVRDLATLYARLLEHLDAREVTVVGNSVGGWIAAELALLGSPRVRDVVLIDAVGAEVDGHPVTDISTLAPPQLVALSFADPGRAAGPAPRPDLVAANMATLFGYGGRGMTDPTLLPRLAGVTVPAHVIWGSADGIVSPDYGRAYADAIPTATFTLLEDTGHLPQLETPEQLLRIL